MENNEHDQPIEASVSEQPQQPDKNVFTIKLSLFEGPLDLLLYLIKQNEIDIYDIPIVLITEQFIEYIDIMKALAIDVATEFIVMAAYLIHLKSCMLLPKQALPPDALVEEDPRLPLIRQLLAHKELKEATNKLGEIYEHQKLIYFREPDKESEETILLEELSVSSLFTSFFQILKKRKEDITFIEPEHIRIEDKIDDIVKLLKKRRFIKLSELIVNVTIKEIVVLFLAILELANEKRIRAFQNKEFSEIYIMSRRMAKKFVLVKE